MRDFKKHTSRKTIETVINEPESRREWMLKYFAEAYAHLKRLLKYKDWQDGYHAELVCSNSFIKEKINDIHQNRVKEKVVVNAEDCYFGSALNDAGLDNDLEVEVVFKG